MDNVNRYASYVYATSPEAEAYKSAKYAFDQAQVQDVSREIRALLREELDQAAEACEYAYRGALAEAREHYD